MSIENDFETFVNNLKITNLDEIKITIGEIAKKLNNNYYNLEADKESHMYIVGSIGRETAIDGVSDVDIIFDLPKEIYIKFDDYESKGQSSLLQEIKNVLKERYPKTDISGDGQVVVINFNKYTVELVPGFKQNDDSFKYPDTHGGGSWKTTKPIDEQDESKRMSQETNNNFKYICNMLRAWKNEKGIKFGGLLIDTLSYNFLNNNENYKLIDFNEYLDMIKELFKYLKGLDKEQSYWFALGSNQQVNNCDDGKFIDEAESTYEEIKDLIDTSNDLNTKLREIFGNEFPKNETICKQASFSKSLNYKNTEEFIEDKFPTDIRYNLNLECKVTQNGWRDRLLSHIIMNKEWLSKNKTLNFYISQTDITGTYDIYWKVKNEGKEAIRRNMIRGQIMKTNSEKHIERTDFYGMHYVECYLVKNNVCVAKNRISVPISYT